MQFPSKINVTSFSSSLQNQGWFWLVSKTPVSAGLTYFFYAPICLLYRISEISVDSRTKKRSLTNAKPNIFLDVQLDVWGSGSPPEVLWAPKSPTYWLRLWARSEFPTPFELGVFHLAPMGKSWNKPNIYD